jgi:hypothetical protein
MEIEGTQVGMMVDAVTEVLTVEEKANQRKMLAVD